MNKHKTLTCNNCPSRNRCSLLIEKAKRHYNYMNELPSQFDMAVDCRMYRKLINEVEGVK